MSRLRENLLLHFVLPLADRVMHTNVVYWYKQIQRMQTWTPEQIRNWQEKRLRAFVKHAYEHTIYYRELFDQLGLKPEDIQTQADLKKLPVLTKNTIRARTLDFIPDDFEKIPHRKSHTGGSTGEPLEYYYDEDMWGYVTADRILAWNTNGYRYGDKFVALGSASLFHKKPSLPRRIYDSIRREYALNCVNQDDTVSAHYVEVIRRENIHILYGYAAAMYVFASYVKRIGINLKGQIRGVFTTSENLTEHYREVIEEAFGCRVMDCYGSRDSGITAYEIERHSYRVGYNTLLETTEEYAPNTGPLLTTHLFSNCFPMIRYDFGDAAELAANVDASEYNGQVIRHVDGRTSDVVALENGHKLTATGLAMTMRIFPAIAFDFGKTGKNELTMHIQRGKDWTNKDENLLRSTLGEYIGANAKLQIEYVEEFAQKKNGKRGFFYNE